MVGTQVTRYMEQISKGEGITDDINKTLLVLIPKKENLNSFSDFRSISICIVMYKLITKIASNRLKSIMAKVSWTLNH